MNETATPGAQVPRKLSYSHSGFTGRDLDSFADDIISRMSSENHAVLDCGFYSQVSDPDFSPSGYGSSAAEACSNSARAIRANANGIGRFAPYGCLEGYDLRYRLMPHWARKETMKELGIDLRAAHKQAHHAFGDWDFDCRWLEHLHHARHFEFFFILLVADRKRLVETGALDVAGAIANIIAEIEEESASKTRGRINDKIRARIRERLEVLLLE